MYKIVFLSLLTTIISSCVPQTPAPVEFNNGKSYSNKDSIYSTNTEEELLITPLARDKDDDKVQGMLSDPNSKEEVLAAPKRDNDKIIYHEVQLGETLKQIAEHYDQKQEDIANLNNLEPPYDLEESQIVKIKVSIDTLNKVQIAKPLENKKKNDHPIQNKSKFVKPIDGQIITRFGEVTKAGKSNGINIAAPTGTPIKSVADSTVIYSGNDKKFGNLVLVQLKGSEIYIAYAHMEDLILEKGQELHQGQIVGHVGDTGNVDIPQLRFAIREGKVAVDPLKYIPE